MSIEYILEKILLYRKLLIIEIYLIFFLILKEDVTNKETILQQFQSVSYFVKILRFQYFVYLIFNDFTADFIVINLL